MTLGLRRGWLFGIGALVSAGLGACGGEPVADSTEYKQGALGNGGFLFKCDDSVACDRWSTNNAKDFPTKIATGSTFELRFVASQDQGAAGGSDTYPGSTLVAIGPYVSSGLDGFTTLKPGAGTVLARDVNGAVIDYVTLNIVKPDALVVYEAEYIGDNPTSIEGFAIASTGRRSFRAVAQKDLEAIAGSVHVEWTSSDPTLVAIESYVGGLVNIVGKKSGTATLTAAGAALTKNISVMVTP